MKTYYFLLGVVVIIISSLFLSCGSTTAPNDDKPESPPIIDHNNMKLADNAYDWLVKAKEDLHIAYGHTSHGSQITSGMTGLVNFMNEGGLGLEFPDNFFAFNNGGSDGALDLRDTPFDGANDLGNPDRIAWATATRNYLNENEDINVIIWSWCGQVSSATEEDINTYLGLMEGLEEDYPDVKFVYMTGHVDGSGLEGNLHLRNEQIREYCRENEKILYDFALIESYDPDGNYYGDKYVTDGCDYDSDENGSQDSNWAIEWQESHTEGVDWYQCGSAHSEPLNANQKAYAAWWLWARLAGWSGK